MDETSQKIIDAAMTLVRDKGYVATTTKEIARMENVDQSTVNRHKLKILAKLRKIMESRF